MRKNNKSPYFRDWTTQKLKKEAIAYDQQIYDIGCYGVRDVGALTGILEELNRRKIDINYQLTFN